MRRIFKTENPNNKRPPGKPGDVYKRQDEDWLIRELERRRGWENQLEQREDPSAAGMAVSGLLLLCSVAVCFFSHPAQARLPQNFYFPALALAGVGAAALLYWSVRRHRNE